MAKRQRGEAQARPETIPSSSPEPRPFTKLLSRKELLAVLPGGVTYPTAWEWIRKGILPAAVEIGGRIGWKDNEVYDAIDRLPRRHPKQAGGE
jgi:predicted DNA-binding transcriptional regulator AlpA